MTDSGQLFNFVRRSAPLSPCLDCVHARRLRSKRVVVQKCNSRNTKGERLSNPLPPHTHTPPPPLLLRQMLAATRSPADAVLALHRLAAAWCRRQHDHIVAAQQSSNYVSASWWKKAQAGGPSAPDSARPIRRRHRRICYHTSEARPEILVAGCASFACFHAV